MSDGSQWGIDIQYTIQDKPTGIAEAFLIGEKFIGEDSVTLILGDNIFYGASVTAFSEKDDKLLSGARVFAYQVPDPERYGVIEFSRDGKAISIGSLSGVWAISKLITKVSINSSPSKLNEFLSS